jgi:sialate O-acetylesterase
MKSPSVHPRYKRQVADRLFLGAVEFAYNDSPEGISQGPLPTSVFREDNQLEVAYDGWNIDVRTDLNFEVR